MSRRLIGLFVKAFDHNVGRLDESRCSVALLESKFLDGFGRYDRSHVCVSDCEDHFSQESLNADADHTSCQLVAATPSPIPLSRFGFRSAAIEFEKRF